MNSGTMSRKKAMTYIFAAAVLWSTGGILVKFIDANPFTISGTRSLLALPVLFWIFPPRTLRPTKRAWLFAVFPTATGLLYVAANKLTTAANAIVLQYISPVFIVLIGFLIFHDRLRRADFAVIAACLTGIVLFFFDKLSPGNLLGNFLAILSGITNAVFYVCISRTKEDSGTLMILAQIETILISLPFLFLFPPALTMQSVLAFLAFGFFQRGFSSVLHAKASKHCDPLSAVLISMAEPLLNPLWVMLLYGEKPGKFALLGGAVVIGSVILWNMYNWNSSNTKTETETGTKGTDGDPT